jgi:hypothetical protein
LAMIATTSAIVLYTKSTTAPTLNPVRARTRERERCSERERERERGGEERSGIFLFFFFFFFFFFPFRGCRSLYAYGESHPWMIFLGIRGFLGIFSSTVTFKGQQGVNQ